MIVAKRCSFDAAHFLPDHPGKCKDMHGHHWVVELGVEGAVDSETGMVIDFAILSDFLKEMVVKRYDHTLLNDLLVNPTAENIAERVVLAWELWSKNNRLAVKLAFVRVWETEDSYVEAR